MRSLLRVKDEITEAHQEIQGHYCDYLIERLNIVSEVRFKGSRPLQDDHHSDRGSHLNSDLAPKELHPENER